MGKTPAQKAAEKAVKEALAKNAKKHGGKKARAGSSEHDPEVKTVWSWLTGK